MEKCRQQIPELRGVGVDNLMYVKVRPIRSPHHNPALTPCPRRRTSSYLTCVPSLLRVPYLRLTPPQHYTFYDFIVNKARGKSGPLFNFDVHDDVRLLADATVEKDESHAGKVVERSYYQRNKHIFPASRWEVRLPGFALAPCAVAHEGGLQVYDPEKNYGQYKIA